MGTLQNAMLASVQNATFVPSNIVVYILKVSSGGKQMFRNNVKTNIKVS